MWNEFDIKHGYLFLIIICSIYNSNYLHVQEYFFQIFIYVYNVFISCFKRIYCRELSYLF